MEQSQRVQQNGKKINEKVDFSLCTHNIIYFPVFFQFLAQYTYALTLLEPQFIFICVMSYVAKLLRKHFVSSILIQLGNFLNKYIYVEINLNLIFWCNK